MELAELRENVEVLKEIKTTLEIASFESGELEELCENLGSDDFTIELDGCEYRFIDEDSIDSIYEDAIKELVEDCYLGGVKEIPWWIEIDWAKTAQNCLSDGYAHTFAHYDGMEHTVEGYYIFRTN